MANNGKQQTNGLSDENTSATNTAPVLTKSAKRRMKMKRKRSNRIRTLGRQIQRPVQSDYNIGVGSDHCFRIIDKRYSAQVEILKGLVTYKRPLIGQISASWYPVKERFVNTLERSLHRWAELSTVGYTELRSQRSIVGITSTASLSEANAITADFIYKRYLRIVLSAIDNDSFPLYLERLGLNEMLVPEFINDILKVVVPHNRIHRLKHTEDQSMVKLSIDVDPNVELEIEEELGKVKNLTFERALTDLAHLANQANLGKGIPINDMNSYNKPIDHLANCYIYDFTKQGETDKDKLAFMLSYTTTEKDVALTLLNGLWFVSTTFPKDALDTRMYYVNKNYIQGPLRNFFVNHYLNGNDEWSSPQVDTPLEEEYNSAYNNMKLVSPE